MSMKRRLSAHMLCCAASVVEVAVVMKVPFLLVAVRCVGESPLIDVKSHSIGFSGRSKICRGN